MSEGNGTLPPQDIEAEKGLLSSLLKEGWTDRVFSIVSEHGLSADAFMHPGHRALFETCNEMWSKRTPIDPITVTSAMRGNGTAAMCGGAAGVMDLATFLPTAANAESYALILQDLYRLRRLTEECERATSQASGSPEDVAGLIAGVSERISSIAQISWRSKPKTARQLLREKMERFQTEPEDTSIRTGLSKLDLLSPVARGDMPLIAGEAKAGKSALAMTICGNLIVAGEACGYFTLEMTEQQQFDRLFHGEARVPIVRDRVSRLQGDDMGRFERANMRLKDSRFQLRDDLQDLPSICAASRQLKAQWPDLAAIFVDYAQLVRAQTRKQDTRETEVATVSRTLRLLAMEMNVAIFVLSQLNKGGDTRESKALENDATAIWKIGFAEDKPRERDIWIPRQRNGESGVGFRAAFFGEFARVECLANEPS